MENSFSSAFFYLREYLFPQGCGGCGGALLNTEDSTYGLCKGCRDFLSAALEGEERCEICGKPLISERITCLSCRQRANGLERYSGNLEKLKALFPYRGKYQAILGAYKFNKSLGVGNFLAQCLVRTIPEFVSTAQGDWTLVPVPPRPGKKRSQGWDQIEYLAGVLEKTRLMPLNRCLKRLPSRSQKELNREERGNNLKGRILCGKEPPKKAIIFDDVITTGATINACASALLRGGTEKVYGLCLFYD